MNTIQINLLETKQIAAYVNGYSYALEGGYHIVAGEANATQFQLVSVPEQYEKATFYVNMINSQHKMVKEKLSVSLNGKFILPVGMAIAGYGQLIFSCNFNGETVIWVPLKVKVWNTRADWEIDTLSIPQDTLKRLEEAEGRINKLEDELIHPTTTFSIFRVGKTDIYASEGENTLTLLAGDNITLEANEVEDSIKISATGGTAEYPPATEDTDGLMSAEDKKNLDDIVSVFGSEAGDPDLLVNTIREILEIFENYPEGLNLQTELTNVKRTANSALQPKDVKIRTEDFCRYTEKVRKSILKPTEGMKAGKETTIEIYDEIESENEIEFPSDELPNISFDGRRIEGNYSGDDGKIEWNIIPIYNEAGKYVIHVYAVITWNSDTSSGVIEVPYDEVSTHDVSGGNFEFPLEKGSIITFHAFKNELESDKHLVIEGTRIRAEGYTDFASGYVTLVAGKNIGIAQEGNKFTIIGADIPDVPKNVVTTDTVQEITGKKTFTQSTVFGNFKAGIQLDPETTSVTVYKDNSGVSLQLPFKFGTVALEEDIPDISGLAEKTQVQEVKTAAQKAQETADSAKNAAQTAQSTADSAKTAAQKAQSSANSSLQPEDVMLIAEKDSGNLNLPLKKGTKIFFHGFDADLVGGDSSISIDGTRLKAAEGSQESVGGDITLNGDDTIHIFQHGREFTFSASLPENHVTTDTDQDISGAKTFSALGGLKVKDTELGDTTQITSSSITVGFGNRNASSEHPLEYLVINPSGLHINEDLGNSSGDSVDLSFPKQSGTIALDEDIPKNAVTTDTAQEITGAKTFKGNVTFGDFTTRGLGVNAHGTGFSVYVDSVGYPVSFQAKSGTVALLEDFPSNLATTDNLEDYLSLSGGDLTDNAQIWRNGNNVPWANGREAAVLRIGSTGEWTYAGGSQYCPLFSIKSENGSWDFGSYNDEAHLLYIKDSDYDGGNHVRTADYKFPQNKSGTVALEEETLRTDDFRIHITRPGESFTTTLNGRVDFEFHGFDFDHEESGGIKVVSVDGTRITANGAPAGYISGDITFKGNGITIAQAGKEITFGAVAPTWDSIDDKPEWIGSTKPSYSWSEIGSKPSWIGNSKPSCSWSEITGSLPSNIVTTDTAQEITELKRFTNTYGITIGKRNEKGEVLITSDGFEATGVSYPLIAVRDSIGRFSTYGLPDPDSHFTGQLALTSDFPTDKEIFLMAHPAGSYYISSNIVSPAILFGGEWEQITNRFLYCVSSISVTGTGGSNTHTLTVNEMPSHNHQMKVILTGYEGNGYWAYNIYSSNMNNTFNGNSNHVELTNPHTVETGGGASFSIMPAYQEVYCWRRKK